MDTLMLKICICNIHYCWWIHSMYPSTIVIFTWDPMLTYYYFYGVSHPPSVSPITNNSSPATTSSTALPCSIKKVSYMQNFFPIQLLTFKFRVVFSLLQYWSTGYRALSRFKTISQPVCNCCLSESFTFNWLLGFESTTGNNTWKLIHDT